MADEITGAGGFDAGEVYVTLGALVDESAFARYDALVQGAKAQRSVKRTLSIDYDDQAYKQFRKDLQDAQRLKDRKVKVTVETGQSERDLDGMGRSLRGADRDAHGFRRALAALPGPMRAVGGGLAAMFGSIGRLSLSFGPLSGKISNLFNVLVALSPILLSLVGVLGALGASAGAAAEGVGALGTALGGLVGVNLPIAIGVFNRFSKVLEVYKNQQKGITDTALNALKATKDQTADTERLRNATESLRDAKQGITRAERAHREAVREARREMRDAARDVRAARQDEAEAERDVATARAEGRRELEAATRAEQAASYDLVAANARVTQARKEALAAQEAVNRSVRDASVDTRQAGMDLADAQDAVGDAQGIVNQLEAEGKAGTEEYSDAVRALGQAKLDLEKAEYRLRDARKAETDAQKDQQKFQEQGVNAFAPYVQAVEDARQAVVALKEAERDRANTVAAHVGGSEQERDAVQRLRDAQERRRDAEERLAELRTAGINQNPRVVASVEAVRDAYERLAEAQRGLRAANQGVGQPKVPTSVLRAQVGEDDLGAVERQLLRVVTKLTTAFNTALQPAVDAVFGGIISLLDDTIPLLGEYSDEWEAVGKVIGDALASVGDALDDPEWARFFQEFLDQSPGAVEDLLDMLGSLLEIMRDVGLAALPHLVDLLDQAADGLDRISDEWTPESLEEDVATMMASFGEWVELIGQVGLLLHNFFMAGSSEGDSLVSTITDVVRGWNDFLETEEGQEAVREFLKDAIEFAKQLLDLLVPAFKTVAAIGRAIMKAVDALGVGDVFGQALGIFLTARFIGAFKLMDKVFSSILKVAGLKKIGALTEALAPVAAAGAGAGTVGGAGAAGAAAGAGGAAGAAKFGLTQIGKRALGPIGMYLTAAELINAITPDIDKLTLALDELNDAPRGSARFRQIQALSRELQEAVKSGDPAKLRRVSESIDGLGDSAQNVYNKRAFQDLADDVRAVANDRGWKKVQGEAKESRDEFQRMSQFGGGYIENLRKAVQINMSRISGRLGKDSQEGKAALTANFNTAIENVKDAMRSGETTTRRGMREIRKLVQQNLSLYGDFSIRQLRNISLGTPQGGQYGDPDNNQGREGGAFRAVGGWVGRAGERGRDMVRAVLGRGEAVLNHWQQNIVNAGLRRLGMKGGLAQLFKGRTGRHHLAEGGYAGEDGYAQGGFVQGAISTGLKAHVMNFARQMFRRGFSVTSAMRPGDPRQHGQGEALDFGDSVNDLNALYRIVEPIKGRFNQVLGPRGLFNGTERFFNSQLQADHTDHIHLGFAGAIRALMEKVLRPGRIAGGGAVGSMVDGALRATITAANTAVRALVDSTGYGPGQHGAGQNLKGANAQANRALGRRMMLDYPYPSTEWPALDTLWTRESGWNQYADNPTSDAYGIPQALPGSKMATSGPDWLTNPATQIDWGLDYIKGRYGSPSGALAHSNAVGWYDGGGFAGGPNKLSNQLRGQLRGIKVAGLTDKLAALEDRYTAKESLYDASEETFIIMGDADTPAQVDQKQVNKRLRELGELIKLREKIIIVMEKLRDRLAERVAALQQAMAMIRAAMKGASSKDRKGYKKLLQQYGAELDQAQTDSINAKAAWITAGNDLKELQEEKWHLASGATTAALISELSPEQGGPPLTAEPDDPSPPDSSSDTDPDLEAQNTRLQELLTNAQLDFAALQGNFAAFTSSGDLGSAQGATAWDSVMADAGGNFTPAAAAGPTVIVNYKGILRPTREDLTQLGDTVVDAVSTRPAQQPSQGVVGV